ncbi:alpha-L-fucosidase [Salegentibacter agarivorans]|uniref:alpha-L-fucosidase n=1 Tax=Salegentibacter agarivorans TaxID=345907 RepID=A0A1I2KM02_9FLAO|nr:alpha-L-fucosidase [Salegentibacter agarivorans]SFF67995.1 alpha-L-fucosidase [Salegentibacter agarivorans]
MKNILNTIFKTALFIATLLVISCDDKKQKENENEQHSGTLKKYEPTWESLKEHETPEWFRDAKFGIYCHWGPYSVPAYKNEWYSHNMYIEGNDVREHHEKTYGPLDEFGYKDFIPMFTAEKFDANEWAKLFKDAGAKFGGPVSEHADGFAMWDSDLTEWDAMDKGPKRDIVGEMAEALRKQNLKFIATYHRHWLYAWYPTWDENTDASNSKYSGLYGPKVPEGTFVMAEKPTTPLPDNEFNKEWLDRLKEIVDKYEPDLVWFDNKMDIIDEDTRKQFLKYYYNAGLRQNREVVATYKFTDFVEGSAVLDVERSRMSEGKDFPWLTDDSIDWKSWSHIENPDYKSANRLIDVLVDIVSKNGNLLLNITPKANGEIPQPVKDRLLDMGAWLETNGEAIYGTRPWKIYGEGPTQVVEGHLSEDLNKENTEKDIRYTTKDEILYAITLGWPKSKLLFPALAKSKGYYDKEVTSVKLLGSELNLDWEMTEEGLAVQLPKQKQGKHAFVFKIEGK